MIYKKFIPAQNKATPFIIFSSFLMAYIITRLFVYFFPWIFLEINGVHIHHFAYGIIIITFVGLYEFIVRPAGRAFTYTLILFGIGMALAYDEFGMWIRLRDYDVSRYGYDAVIIISALFLNIIYFSGFWEKMGRRIFSRFKKRYHFKI